MIHTFEIKHTFSLEKFNNIAGNTFDQEQIDSFLHGDTAVLSLSPYRYLGVNDIDIYKANDGFIILCMIINPQSMITQSITLDLFECSPSSLQALSERFTATLEQIGLYPFPTITEWFVSRIDYALDLHTDNVDKYVALSKKELRPAWFIDYTVKEGSSYPESKSVSLNFYDKEDQVRKKMSAVPSFDQLLAAAHNRFRVEVQCHTTKIKAVREKLGLSSTRLGNFLSEDIALDLIHYYYRYLMGYGAFYSLAEAERIVNSQKWRGDRKAKFIEWLNFVAAHDNLTIAKANALRAGSICRATLSTYTNLSNRCGINFLTLPPEWGLTYLRNPLAPKG